MALLLLLWLLCCSLLPLLLLSCSSAALRLFLPFLLHLFLQVHGAYPAMPGRLVAHHRDFDRLHSFYHNLRVVTLVQHNTIHANMIWMP